MNNYTLKYSIGEAAGLFKVDIDTVKKWCYHFSEYLSNAANPAKGKQREFNIGDLRVLGYIIQYWEAEPDLENIKYGLNTTGHYDNFLVDEFLLLNTPFIIEPPEGLDESWKHGVLYVGLSEFADTFALAKSYKRAGDRLIGVSLENEEALELYPPAIFNYRHAVELYIKAITGKGKQTHNLSTLLEQLKIYLKAAFGATLPEWMSNLILTFHDFDPYGTTLRYGGASAMEEMFIDFDHLKRLMQLLDQSFHNIKFHQGISRGM